MEGVVFGICTREAAILSPVARKSAQMNDVHLCLLLKSTRMGERPPFHITPKGSNGHWVQHEME